MGMHLLEDFEKTPSNQQESTSQRTERLLTALNRLKLNICSVEERHPYLGNELSSLCEAAVAHLNDRKVEEAVSCQNQQCDIDNDRDSQAATAGLFPPVKRNPNLFISVIDKAGGHLITGLDKSGDGIILFFEKLLGPGTAKAKFRTPADSDIEKSPI